MSKKTSAHTQQELQRRDLSDAQAFDERFDELRTDYPNMSYFDIYAMVEVEHAELFRRTKYSNFDSFRQSYYVRLRRRIKGEKM